MYLGVNDMTKITVVHNPRGGYFIIPFFTEWKKMNTVG